MDFVSAADAAKHGINTANNHAGRDDQPQPQTVLATYAHLLPHSDAEAAQVVAAALVTNG